MCSDTVIVKLRSTEVKLYGALLLDPSEAIKAKIEKKTRVSLLLKLTSTLEVVVAGGKHQSNFYLAAIDPNAILIQPLPHSFMRIFSLFLSYSNSLAPRRLQHNISPTYLKQLSSKWCSSKAKLPYSSSKIFLPFLNCQKWKGQKRQCFYFTYMPLYKHVLLNMFSFNGFVIFFAEWTT